MKGKCVTSLELWKSTYFWLWGIISNISVVMYSQWCGMIEEDGCSKKISKVVGFHTSYYFFKTF